jgi:hypothetical protein
VKRELASRGLARTTVVVATALPVLGLARLAAATKRYDIAARLRVWADATSLVAFVVTAPLWLILVLRGVLYPTFGSGDLRNSWGGPTMAGAWAAHLAVCVGMLLTASFLLALWGRMRRSRSENG